MRECGLKQQLFFIKYASSFHVTPRAGVWIETFADYQSALSQLSLPVRECGLDPDDKTDGAGDGCGL